MSVVSVQAFLQQVRESKDLQVQLSQIDSEEAFFEVVSDAGYEFTKKEWALVVPQDVLAGSFSSWKSMDSPQK